MRLANPMSEDQSVLRTLLLGPLLDNLERNRARGNEDVRLWQYGAVYLAHEPRREGRRPPAAATATTCPASTACRPSASTSARCSPAACGPPSWRDPEPRAGRLLRRQGRARAR